MREFNVCQQHETYIVVFNKRNDDGMQAGCPLCAAFELLAAQEKELTERRSHNCPLGQGTQEPLNSGDVTYKP